MQSSTSQPDFASDRPLVFRHATVLTMDTAGVIHDGDVLVVGEQIAAVGRGLEVPEGTIEIDASDGILMPGMVDTHRHLWQTAMRGYGGDWSLSQYFVFYYLTWGKLFRPEDVFGGNLLGAIEAIDSGVTTTLDWSHGLQTTDHAEAAVEALKAVPGRFVLGYGNLLGAPWEWSAAPEFRAFVERHFSAADDMLGLQMAFDVTGQPEFPERAAFEVARDLDLSVTTHAGVWGATTDDGILQMAEGGFMTPRVTYVHASTLSPGLLSADRGDRRHRLDFGRERGQRRTGLSRHPRIPSPRHPDLPLHGHQRVVERGRLLGDACHDQRRPGEGPLRRARA